MFIGWGINKLWSCFMLFWVNNGPYDKWVIKCVCSLKWPTRINAKDTYRIFCYIYMYFNTCNIYILYKYIKYNMYINMLTAYIFTYNILKLFYCYFSCDWLILICKPAEPLNYIVTERIAELLFPKQLILGYLRNKRKGRLL